MRRKYTFKNRGDAEQAYREADRERLLAHWFAEALMNKTNVRVGKAESGETVGYVIKRHSAFVYVLRTSDGHKQISGLWDIDDTRLMNIIQSLLRYNESISDSHMFGLLLDGARTACIKAIQMSNAA